MPTAGGLETSVSGGKDIGCDVVQLFTASPRQWRSSPLKPDAAAKFIAARAETGIDLCVAHDSYLINLAAPDGDVRSKSHIAFRDEIERAEALGIRYLVTHMGAHTGDGIDIGLARLCDSLDKLHDETQGYKVQVALETTAGQGSYLGGRFEEFPKIFDGVKAPERLVICMDTCHVFASGYDIRTPAGFSATLDEFDAVIGLAKLKVVHANDSQKGLGCHVDRHAHIGQGEIGIDAFRFLVNEPRLQGLPIIVETPEAEKMHAVNVKCLRDLIDSGA
jgi:deoxyribonuclease-4